MNSVNSSASSSSSNSSASSSSSDTKIITVEEGGESLTITVTRPYTMRNDICGLIGDLVSKLITLSNSKGQESELSEIRAKISYCQKRIFEKHSVKSFTEIARQLLFSEAISKMEEDAS